MTASGAWFVSHVGGMRVLCAQRLSGLEPVAEALSQHAHRRGDPSSLRGKSVNTHGAWSLPLRAWRHYPPAPLPPQVAGLRRSAPCLSPVIRSQMRPREGGIRMTRPTPLWLLVILQGGISAASLVVEIVAGRMLAAACGHVPLTPGPP